MLRPKGSPIRSPSCNAPRVVASFPSVDFFLFLGSCDVFAHPRYLRQEGFFNFNKDCETVSSPDALRETRPGDDVLGMDFALTTTEGAA
jgi:hypothetical protein